MFVVVQGSFQRGFVFIGTFETRVRALQLQRKYSGQVIEVMTRPSCRPGTTILVFGGPIEGFKVIGTFSNAAAAEAYRKESRSTAWLATLKEEACP